MLSQAGTSSGFLPCPDPEGRTLRAPRTPRAKRAVVTRWRRADSTGARCRLPILEALPAAATRRRDNRFLTNHFETMERVPEEQLMSRRTSECTEW